MKWLSRGLRTNGPYIVALIVLLFVCCAGCTVPTGIEGNPPVQTTQQPTISQVTQSQGSSVQTPFLSGKSSQASTSQETSIPAIGYVKRPYGYHQYIYHPGYQVTPVESHVETDQSGNQVIVGRVKNEGSETIDLVVVTINLYNSNGYQIGNRYASADFLKPGRSFMYTTSPITEKGFAYHEIADVFAG